MSVKVKDNDLGWKDIKNEIKSMRKAKVRVGILKSAGMAKQRNADGSITQGDVSVAEIAFWNEYGTSRGVPERPFIRKTADEKGDAYAKYLKQQLSKVFAGQLTVTTALERVGNLAQGHVRKNIRDIRTPPNAAVTIERKGSSNPLIDTATMLKQVNFEVKK